MNGCYKITKTGYLNMKKDESALYNLFKTHRLIIKECGNCVTAFRGLSRTEVCVIYFVG